MTGYVRGTLVQQPPAEHYCASPIFQQEICSGPGADVFGVPVYLPGASPGIANGDCGDFCPCINSCGAATNDNFYLTITQKDSSKYVDYDYIWVTCSCTPACDLVSDPDPGDPNNDFYDETSAIYYFVRGPSLITSG